MIFELILAERIVTRTSRVEVFSLTVVSRALDDRSARFSRGRTEEVSRGNKYAAIFLAKNSISAIRAWQNKNLV